MAENYYVIADIHGCRELLDKALEWIYDQQEGGEIIFLGDYIDRGPDSLGVLRTLITSPKSGWNFTCLMGNHEEACIDYDRKNYNDLELSWMSKLPLYHIVDDNIFVHADWKEEWNKTPPKKLSGKWELSNEDIMLYNRRKTGFKHPTLYLTYGHTPHKNAPYFMENCVNLDAGAVFFGELLIGVYERGVRGPVNFMRITNE